ncbi:MAG TPA: DMT family transporter [Pseudonocardiaceae bacterium]|jgi:drug/metabolite transporter (DMT)-like permease|nr:DMT family transporter [Pseudonocardiaceae bacterium]
MGANTVMLVIAVPAAIAGAAFMGLASAAQARAAHEVPDSKTLNPRLLIDLAHRKLWLIGIGATIAGLVLQVVALGFGPLLLVQPLLVTALPFASSFAALMAHRKPDRVLVFGGLLCVAGLSAFLLLAKPTGGSDQLLPPGQLIPLAIALAAIVVGALGWAAVVRGNAHVLGLAVATGVTYGVTAALIKVVAGELREGIATPFTHWTLYAVCIIGPVGFLLSQNTFQQGKLVSPALAVITTVDPLVGVAIGVWWLDESASTGTAVLTGEIIAAVAIVAGIGMVTRRAAHRQTDQAKSENAAPPAAEQGQPMADEHSEGLANPS